MIRGVMNNIRGYFTEQSNIDLFYARIQRETRSQDSRTMTHGR